MKQSKIEYYWLGLRPFIKGPANYQLFPSQGTEDLSAVLLHQPGTAAWIWATERTHVSISHSEAHMNLAKPDYHMQIAETIIPGKDISIISKYENNQFAWN